MMKNLLFMIHNKGCFYALASGILLFLSFPKYGSGIIAWIAFIPLFYSLKNAAYKDGVLAGFGAGFVFYIGIIYWIIHVVVKYGYQPLYVGVAAMILLAFYLSLYIALFGLGIVFSNKKGLPLYVSAPSIWICLEYAKSQLFTGFPWENLGYSQYANYYLVQLADITGVYGISFVIVFINALLFEALSNSGNRRVLIRLAVSGCIIMGLVYSYGLLRVNHVQKAESEAKSMKVLLVQGNIEQDVKWNPRYQLETVSIYRNLSLKHGQQPGLIVWPETATPFFFQDINDLNREVLRVASSSRSWLLFGSPSYTKDSQGMAIYNSAFLLSPEGTIEGKYDKMHLVPFGEYVPLRQFLPFIGKLVVGVGDFQTGIGYIPLKMESHKPGVLICYEGILPEAAGAYKRAGADLLINITNDAWFGMTSAPYQHLSMTTFRAIENRMYLVRAANTGISAIIDPKGKVLSQSPLFEQATVQGIVKYVDQRTIYSSYGDVFVYLCLFFTLGMIIYSFIKKGGSGHAGRI